MGRSITKSVFTRYRLRKKEGTKSGSKTLKRRKVWFEIGGPVEKGGRHCDEKGR